MTRNNNKRQVSTRLGHKKNLFYTPAVRDCIPGWSTLLTRRKIYIKINVMDENIY
jgi:hypothetical protein